MTTPVRGRSLTTRPLVATPQPAPQVVRPRVKRNRIKRFKAWQSAQHRKHPFTWWCVVIAISLLSFRALYGAVMTWPVFRGYFLCFAIFWGTCIGMLPITAIFRSGQNITEDIFK